MNVSLGEKWDHFVEVKVKSGDFEAASEVLREGLRLLEKEELPKRISVGSMAELETKLLKAAASLNAGKGVNAKPVFNRPRQRRKTNGAIDGALTNGADQYFAKKNPKTRLPSNSERFQTATFGGAVQGFVARG